MEMHNGGFESGQPKIRRVALCENSVSRCVNCVERENVVMEVCGLRNWWDTKVGGAGTQVRHTKVITGGKPLT